MSKVPVNPPSGFRDFLPGEAAARLELVSTITRIYRSHGFQPIGMSMLENLSTLQGKGGGGENEKLIFKVMQRGDALQRGLSKYFERHRAGEKDALDKFAGFDSEGKAIINYDELADMGLRFDLTLPLARYCARFRNELPNPFKVFQIGPVWRADRPQKGRFREFYQCDVDIVGAKDIGAEVDCISAIVEVFQSVGISQIEVHLNDRRLLGAVGRNLIVSPVQWSKCLVELDKLDKLPPEKVLDQIRLILSTDSQIGTRLDSVSNRIIEAFTGKVDPQFWLDLDRESAASIMEIKSQLEDLFVKPGSPFAQTSLSPKIVFNPTLVRGQDYYTGTIFEIRHPELSGSLGGGGRYNRLMEVFGAPETPAFGGSIGFERLVMLLEEKASREGKSAADSSVPHLFFALFDGSLRSQIQGLAAALRRAGLRVDVFPDAAKLKNQFKYADDRKIPYTAILGADEAKAGVIKVKDMAKGTETSYSIQPPETFVEEMVKLCRR